jgi:glycosyltransferase involved in cell wall biosynthesis
LLPDTSLVLAGGLGWKYQEIVRAARDPAVSDRVIMPGRVRGEDLSALYSLATAFVFPSLYEGFGLPPLEAMQCGTPVVSSKTSSLPEVVGDSGLLVDPYRIEDIAEALVGVGTDAGLRQELRERGLKRARQFSWRRCAQETLEVYREASDITRGRPVHGRNAASFEEPSFDAMAPKRLSA